MLEKKPFWKTSGTISVFRSQVQVKKLKPHTVDWAQIERFLTSADKKLASAPKILAFDEEACLQQA